MSIINKFRFGLLVMLTMAVTNALGQTLVLNTNSITINANAQDRTFDITSDVAWTVSSNEEWLTISENASGTGDATVKIHATEYTSVTDDRTGTITVSGGGVTETITVTQKKVGPYLSVTTNLMTFSAKAEPQKFDIQSNASWTVVSSADWLSVSPATGSNNQTVTVTASENTSVTADRTGTITVSGGGVTETITVTQKKVGEYLNVTTNLMTFSAKAEPQTFNIQSNASWTVVSSADWLTVSPANGSNDGTITVTASENTSVTADRTGTITVSGGGVTETITVTQKKVGEYLNVTTNLMTFSAKAEPQTFNIQSNASWTVVSSADWLSVSPASGKDNKTVTVTVSENTSVTDDRTGTITVSGGGVTETITVTQKKVGPYLSVTTNLMTFSAKAEPQKFDIQSNASWTVVSSADWLSVSPASGKDNKTVTVTVSENTSVTDDRTGTITVSGGGVTETITVTQKKVGPYLSVTTNLMTFSAKAEPQKFDIQSNASWTVVSSADWLSVSPASGKDNKTVTVTVSENTSVTADRTGTITVSGGGVTETITVTQKKVGPYLSVTTNLMTFSAKAEPQTFNIQSNASWTVVSSADWLTVSPANGSNDGTITVTASENISVTADRTCTITVSGGGVTETITVTQKKVGEYLNVTTNLMTFSAKATPQKFDIQSNAGWTVAVDDASKLWLSVSPATGSNNQTVTVTAAENTSVTADRTGTITVSGGGVTETITVTQKKVGEYLNVTTNLMTFSAKATPQKFDIQSNAGWTVAVDDASKLWLSVSPATGSNNQTVTVTAAENTSVTADRTGTITVSGGGVTETITVTQKKQGDYLSVTTNLMTFSAKAEPQTFDIQSNTGWTVTVDEGSKSWLSVSPATGSNNQTVTVTAAENTSVTDDRTGTITVTGGGVTETIVVTQKKVGEYLNVTTNKITFSPKKDSQDKTFDIQSNAGWTVAVDDASKSWLSVSPATGSNNQTVTVTAAENTSVTDDRTGTITVTGGGVTETINVTQLGYKYMLEVGTNLISFTEKSGVYTFNVASNTSWDVTIDDSGKEWLELNPQVESEGKKEISGTGDGMVTVKALSNESNPEPRKAIIKVTGYGIEEPINIDVTQNGHVDISVQELNGASLSGIVVPVNLNKQEYKFFVKTDEYVKWDIKLEKEWLSTDETKGNGSKTVTITIDENKDKIERVSKVSLGYNDSQGNPALIEFAISQERSPDVPTLRFVDNDGNIIDVMESTIGESVTLKLRAEGSNYEEKRWTCKWKINDEYCENEKTDYLFTPSESKKYNFDVEMIYKDHDSYRTTASLVFYPTPKVPTKLDKKGKTGASGIMIAEMDIPDSQLEADRYMFVFGYDDTAFAPTSSKYYQYGPNLVRDNNVTKWVYTQWDIEGRIVKSLTRRLYEAGEEDYTRGAADNAALQNGEIILTPGHIRAHVDVPEPAIISVLSMSGVVLQSVSLSPRQDFDEQLDFKGLQSGMYILRCTIGDYKTEQKFVIK